MHRRVRTLLHAPAVPSSGENNAAKVVMHAFRRFDADWAASTGGRNLEELFRPPMEIMFVGTFAEVRRLGVAARCGPSQVVHA
jgi:hypothetical protein